MNLVPGHVYEVHLSQSHLFGYVSLQSYLSAGDPSSTRFFPRPVSLPTPPLHPTFYNVPLMKLYGIPTSFFHTLATCFVQVN